MQVHNYTSTQLYKYTSTKIYKYTSIQVHKYTSTQVHWIYHHSSVDHHVHTCPPVSSMRRCAPKQVHVPQLKILICLGLFSIVYSHKEGFFCRSQMVLKLLVGTSKSEEKPFRAESITKSPCSLWWLKIWEQK